MLTRRTKIFTTHCETILLNLGATRILFSTSSDNVRFTANGVPEHTELPRKLQRAERKPLVTSVNELKRRARLEKKMKQEVREIPLRPPENGLLVKKLIPVAHEVYAARTVLFDCVSRIVGSVIVHHCRFCGEVHVGPIPHQIRTCNVVGSPPSKEHSWEEGGVEHILPLVESFHLYDRLGRAVSHEERLLVDRIPAIVELCVQAGMDIPEYPTRRRTFPVYSIAGKIIDFERKFLQDESTAAKDIEGFGFWEKKVSQRQSSDSQSSGSNNLQDLAVLGLDAWEKMRSGARKLMQKYAVQVCGYCPEVQVGTKGHRVRVCQAYKHQMRDGQHAWQDGTVDDLVPPVYVWHVLDPHVGGGVLVDRLRPYYGKLPAVVELCVQAGARVGEEYRAVMRADVAVPELEEERWVV